MNLKIQCFSFLFSFLFGIFFFLILYFHRKFLFTNLKIFKFINPFVFVLDMSLLYFLGLKKINEGKIHIYFLFVFLIGCYCSCKIMKYIQNKRK